MSDFLDFGELESVAQRVECAGKSHPLRDVIDASVKVAYVGGLAFGALSDDNEMQDRERNAVIGVALSLGVSEEEANDVIGQVLHLEDKDKIGYFKEVCSQIEGRETRLFFVLDMLVVMRSDGGLTENAKRLLGAAYKVLGISSEDVQAVEKFTVGILEKSSWTYGELSDNSLLGGEDEVLQRVFKWFEPEAVVMALNDLMACECKVSGLIKSFVDKIGSVNGCTVAPIDNIPNESWVRMHKLLQVQEKRHILQIEVDSFLSGEGSGNGVVLTWKALYYKDGDCSSRILWPALLDCKYAKKELMSVLFGPLEGLKFNGGDVMTFSFGPFGGVFMGGERGLKLLARLITDVANILGKRKLGLKDDWTSEA